MKAKKEGTQARKGSYSFSWGCVAVETARERYPADGWKYGMMMDEDKGDSYGWDSGYHRHELAKGKVKRQMETETERKKR